MGSTQQKAVLLAKGTKMAKFTTNKNQHKNCNDIQDNTPPCSHTIKCTLLLQPPEQQEAMTNQLKCHSLEYRSTKTHTSLQQSEHGIACQQC